MGHRSNQMCIEGNFWDTRKEADIQSTPDLKNVPKSIKSGTQTMNKLNSSVVSPIKIHNSPVSQRFSCFHGKKLHFNHSRMNLNVRTVRTTCMSVVESGNEEIISRVACSHLMMTPLTRRPCRSLPYLDASSATAVLTAAYAIC